MSIPVLFDKFFYDLEEDSFPLWTVDSSSVGSSGFEFLSSLGPFGLILCHSVTHCNHPFQMNTSKP
jgi:hypothetical protein